jgi:hypothetical protein
MSIFISSLLILIHQSIISYTHVDNIFGVCHFLLNIILLFNDLFFMRWFCRIYKIRENPINVAFFLKISFKLSRMSNLFIINIENIFITWHKRGFI